MSKRTYVCIGLAKKFVLVVNTLFYKVLGENEKSVFYFYLKLNELFGQSNNIINIIQQKKAE